MTERPPIAILVKRFPKLSETFILSEVLALEALGWPVTIFTLLPPSDEIEHTDVSRVEAEIVLLDQFRPACHLAHLMRLRGIRHLHSHFADSPAEIGRAAALTAGIGYSVSAHAKDIYLSGEATLRQNLGDARFVVTCTSHNAQHLRKIAPGVPIAKLYHGIDCSKLKPDPAARSVEPPLILSVGRLRIKKGLDTLIESCALLHAQDVAFRCEIIGYGPEEAKLKQHAEQHGIGHLIHFAGKQSHDDVLARMRAASIFALPCRIEANGDRDGIPNVILEAMAMGLPVVSTPVSGVPEILSEGQTGWMVPPDDPAALAALLETLIAQGTDHTITSAARKAVHSRFGEGRDIAMLDRLLLGAVGQGAAGIGYVIKGFPRLSESFISSEVLRLERLGKRITVFSLGDGDELAAPVLADMTSPLAYMPSAFSVKKLGLFAWVRAVTPAYLPIHWRLFRKRPRAWLATFAQAVQFAGAYRHPTEGHVKRSYFKQFLQAGAIAEALPRVGITHLHGHFCHNATTITWFAAQMAGCSFSFTAHAKDIYQEKHNPGDLLQRKINAASFVTTCTSANHDHLAEKLGELPTLHTVYHGLDTGIFRAVEREATPTPRLIAVGRHVEKKGFDLLITALRILRKRGVILPCRIIGEPGPATDALDALIASSSLSEQISLDPPLPHARLRECYGAADIFVLPCRIDKSGDRDGIPNVLAEAMATGLAVISTNVSGIPELVRDGKNGLLVPPDDAQALADAIEQLAVNQQLRGKLGAAAVATIHEIFDADRTILQMDQLFGKALKAAA